MTFTREAVHTLERSVAGAMATMSGESAPEHELALIALRDLAYRTQKLASAWDRPPCLGFFGPSQAGKSFLVGALLSHELGSLQVVCRDRTLDFLKEINPAKGVESTGVVTRFSTRAPQTPVTRGDFECRVLSLEVLLESLATGFLVECTSPSLDADRLERCMRDAKLQSGVAAPAMFRAAWDAVWHNLTKKYQDRHPYLNELRRRGTLGVEAWKDDIRTSAGWMMIYSLLWGGPGYAADLDQLMARLVQGLDLLGHPRSVEVGVEHVRATSDGVSLIDAACLNAVGTPRGAVRVYAADAGRDVAVDPGVLSALISEIRLSLRAVPGSLLDRCDILDFPGGRALKGINGFGAAELNSGKLDNAIEVFKRGKLTFLFEQFAIDREITALCLCSPGPTKPEAVQLQSQVESWLRIRNGAPTPTAAQEIEQPSLFIALTKFDMSLGTLRSDNARDRWDSRVQEACVDFWSRGSASWLSNWGGKGQPFANMFWIRNPYADQMRSLHPGDGDYETIKAGYFQSRAVQRHIKTADEKWSAVEGDDDKGMPKSGVPLLSAALRQKMQDDVKGRELDAEAAQLQSELVSLLRSLTPSKDASEERQRILESASQLTDAVRREMARASSGSVFGELMALVTVDEELLAAEVVKAHAVVAPMSIKSSDKVKKLLVYVLKWWTLKASERVRASNLAVPPALLDMFVREVCTSKMLLPILGNAIYPYMLRSSVDCALIAKILMVKIGDALMGLFENAPRHTPRRPIRLSYSESSGPISQGDQGGQAGQGGGAKAIDWADVDFGAEDAAAGVDLSTNGVEIIFAGSRWWKRWSERLGEFYVKNRGGQVKVAAEHPRVVRLAALLRDLESVRAGPG